MSTQTVTPGEGWRSAACATWEHSRCRSWRSCQCRCHNGTKLRRDILRDRPDYTKMDKPPF